MQCYDLLNIFYFCNQARRALGITARACHFVYCYRPYWRCYYANTDALVYVIDSVDKDRLATARAELSAMLQVNWEKSWSQINRFRRKN